MIADVVAFWLAGSRDWWYRGGPAADNTQIRKRPHTHRSDESGNE